MDETANTDNTVSLGSGSVEYALTDAAVAIDELIDALQQAKDDGATFVVGLSGNYRGARWSRLSSDVNWLEDDGL